MQPDGKIVVGDVQVQDKRCRQVLMRYSPEGTLDAYFGTGGKVIGDLEGYIFGEVAVLLQPDGRILIMGCDGISRYKQDGSLDQRFGVGGKVTLELGHESFGDRGLARAFAADREGNLVVLGYLYKFATAEKEIVLARYHSDGTPDTRFGTGGKAYLRVHSYNPPFAIAILPDGKLLVAGNILVRYHPDGSIDQSFGSGGLVILASYHSFTDAFALAVQPDGKILIASYLPGDKDTRTDYALVRFLSDGTLDTGFGRGGIVSTDFSFGNDKPQALTIQPDGKILVAGESGVNHFFGGWGPFFSLARYNPDGSLDTGFGKVLVDPRKHPIGYSAGATALAVQADGKILVAGGGLLIRLLNDLGTVGDMPRLLIRK